MKPSEVVMGTVESITVEVSVHDERLALQREAEREGEAEHEGEAASYALGRAGAIEASRAWGPRGIGPRGAD